MKLLSGTGRLKYPVEYDQEDYNSLIDLNDAGMPFTQIADVIEAQFIKGENA